MGAGVLGEDLALGVDVGSDRRAGGGVDFEQIAGVGTGAAVAIDERGMGIGVAVVDEGPSAVQWRRYLLVKEQGQLDERINVASVGYVTP